MACKGFSVEREGSRLIYNLNPKCSESELSAVLDTVMSDIISDNEKYYRRISKWVKSNKKELDLSDYYKEYKIVVPSKFVSVLRDYIDRWPRYAGRVEIIPYQL